MSNVTIAQLHQALLLAVAGVQNVYSLLDRSSEPLLDLCRERDIAWVPLPDALKMCRISERWYRILAWQSPRRSSSEATRSAAER